uniref:Uncharacterized protein n=2 Tax=Aegilops tauschii TaxID=37682 RepID=A0A453BQ05_AEGTS
MQDSYKLLKSITNRKNTKRLNGCLRKSQNYFGVADGSNMWAGLSRIGKGEENGNPITIVEIGADGRGLLLGMNLTVRMPRGWTGDDAGHTGAVARELRESVYIGNGLLAQGDVLLSWDERAKCVPPEPQRRIASGCVAERPGVAAKKGMGSTTMELHRKWHKARHNRPGSCDGERPGAAGLDY